MSSENPQLLIQPNPRFTFLNQDPVLVAKNCPESVNYNMSPMKGTGVQNLSFQLDIEGAFLNRAVTLDLGKVPLRFIRKSPIDAANPSVSKTLAQYFGQYDSICLRQFALLNGIEAVRTTIDGQLHHTCTDVAKMMSVISQYYDKEDVHQHFNASLPDMYPDYDDYNNGLLTLPVVGLNEDGVIPFKKPVLANGNIFSSIDPLYSTRIPMFSPITTGLTGSSTVASAYLYNQRCPLPFNIFGISTDDIPLYLGKTILVHITMKANWWRQLSSISAGSSADLADIDFDFTQLNTFTPRLEYTLYNGPAYQEKEAPNITKLFIGVPTVTTLTGGTQIEVTGGKLQKVQQMKFQMENVPIRAYLYAKALYKKSDEADPSREARIPDLYGRVESLAVKLTNTETRIASGEPGRVYDLCKAAGLNKTYEQAMFLSGYSVCLDMSEALSTKSNTLISSAPGGTAPILSVDVSFRNLNTDEIMYEIGVIAVYDTILMKKDGKWDFRNTITADTFSTDQHIGDVLADATIQKGNMIGSGFLDTLLGVAKKIGPGIWNLGKALVTNKDGFRDSIVDKWQGGFGSRIPTMGGGVAYNQHPTGITGGALENWAYDTR